MITTFILAVTFEPEEGGMIFYWGAVVTYLFSLGIPLIRFVQLLIQEAL
jgi:hypothetical protein